MTTLTILRLPLSAIVPDPRNARTHNDRNLAEIRNSLLVFGQAEPLVVQAGTRRLIAGHGRLEVMRRLGWAEADVVELAVDDRQATALGIALNRTAELAGWDDEVLAKALAELKDAVGLEGVGFDEREVERLLREAGLVAAGPDDEGAVEPPVVPVSRPGDLWLLGDHRLLCGDSTSEEDVARLMGEERAALMATDPPYLVDYDGSNHPQGVESKAEQRNTNKEWDAYVDPAASVEFFRALLAVALARALTPNPAVYQWHASRRQALVEQAWEANGLFVHQQLVWVKSRPILTRSHYMWQHEPCFYGWIKGKGPTLRPAAGGENTTVWTIANESEGIHPTQKPLEIFERPILAHTAPGDVVYEPFSGSGTQLVAAERHGRRCRAMEISPAFVDAALLRWERASGKRATLAGSGRGFAETGEERGVGLAMAK